MAFLDAVGSLYLHTAWKTALVAALLAGVLAILRTLPAARRATLVGWALAASVVLVVATLVPNPHLAVPAAVTSTAIVPGGAHLPAAVVAPGDGLAAPTQTPPRGAEGVPGTAPTPPAARVSPRTDDGRSAAPAAPSPGPWIGQAWSDVRGPALAAAARLLDRVRPVLGALWLVAAALALARLVLAALEVRGLLRSSESGGADGQRAVDGLAARTGLARAPAVRISSAVRGLTLVGLRPVLLVPAQLELDVARGRLDGLLLHELEHVRRRDPLLVFLVAAFDVVLPMHPGRRWMSRRLREEREQACDAAAVAATGDARGYVAQLLTAAHARAGTDGRLRLAASDGSLVDRARAVLGLPRGRRPARLALPALAVGAALTWAAALAALPPVPHVGLAEELRPVDLAALLEPGDRWIWFTVVGSLRATPDGSTILEISPGGRVVVEERRVHEWRRVVLTSEDGELRGVATVNGSAVPFDDEARRWLDEVLATEHIRRDIVALRFQRPGSGSGASGNVETGAFVSVVHVDVDRGGDRAARVQRLERSLERIEDPRAQPRDAAGRGRVVAMQLRSAAMRTHHEAAHGLIEPDVMAELLAILEEAFERQGVTTPRPAHPPGVGEAAAAAAPIGLDAVVAPAESWVWLTVVGYLGVDEATGEVVDVHPDGRVVLEERGRDGWRRATFGRDGDEVVVDLVVDGVSAPADEAAMRWAAEALADGPWSSSAHRERWRDEPTGLRTGVGATRGDGRFTSFIHTGVGRTAGLGLRDHLSRAVDALVTQPGVHGFAAPFDAPSRQRGFVHTVVQMHHAAEHGLIAPAELAGRLEHLARSVAAVTSVPGAAAMGLAPSVSIAPGDSWVWVTTYGQVEVIDGMLRPVFPGSRVTVEERRVDGSRRLDAFHTFQPPDSRVVVGGRGIEFMVDGEIAPFDDAARAWLAGILEEPLVREALAREEGAARSAQLDDRSSFGALRSRPGLVSIQQFGATGGPLSSGASRMHALISRLEDRDELHSLDRANLEALPVVIHHYASQGLVTAASRDAYLRRVDALLARHPGPQAQQTFGLWGPVPYAGLLVDAESWIWITIVSDAALDPADPAPPGAHDVVIIEERRPDGARRVELRHPDADRPLEYRVGGSPRPFDAEAAAWLAQILANPVTQHMLSDPRALQSIGPSYDRSGMVSIVRDGRLLRDIGHRMLLDGMTPGPGWPGDAPAADTIPGLRLLMAYVEHYTAHGVLEPDTARMWREAIERRFAELVTEPDH